MRATRRFKIQIATKNAPVTPPGLVVGLPNSPFMEVYLPTTNQSFSIPL